MIKIIEVYDVKFLDTFIFEFFFKDKLKIILHRILLIVPYIDLMA